MFKKINTKRNNSRTATAAAATYVIAAALNTFFASRSSLLLIIPNETTSFIARFDASNSTGHVTTWNNTLAASNTIPTNIRPDCCAIKPIINGSQEKLAAMFATGTNLARNVKNEYASAC